MERCYLLLGPEKGKKEDFINNIKSSLAGCEVSRLYAFDDYEAELFAQLNNNDLFASRKLVILDEAQEIKTKEKAKAICDYMRNPSDSVVFLMLSTELYINAEIMASIHNPKDSIVKFYELFENKKTEWLQNFFRRNNMFIDIVACNAIIEKVDNNIQEFESTCSQIVTYLKAIEGKQKVTYNDVEDFLAHTRQETEFSLFSYLAQGKLEASLECLQTLLHSNDGQSLPAVLPSRLANYFRRLWSLQQLMAKGLTSDEALKTKFFDSDRAISMPKDKDIYKAAIKRYTVRDTQRILVILAQYDIMVKEEGTALVQTVLEKCMMDIIIHKGRHAKPLQFATL